MEDLQCPSLPPNSINAIKTYSKQTNHSQKGQLQTVTTIGTQQPKEPERTIEDEFQDLCFKLLVLEVIAHAPIYNAILDKYVESLELGKNGSAFVQGEMPKRMKDLGLFTLPYRLADSKPFDTLAVLGSCVNIIPLYLFKKLKIGLLEETGHVFELADGTKSYLIRIVRDVKVHIVKLKLLNDFYVIDMKKDPKTPLLVGKGFLATANAVIYCRKAKKAVGEGITRSVFGVKEIDLGPLQDNIADNQLKYCSDYNYSINAQSPLDFLYRLQKIVSQLAILGENISQEDLNLKFLRSLPSEWNTHVVNCNIKHKLIASLDLAFVSSPSKINKVNTANIQVSTANSTVSTDNTLDSTTNLSDATVYAFLSNQPNGSQLVHKDLEQIHEDDLEEMDLKWQLALLSLFAPPTIDLSNSGLEEFQQPKFKGYRPKASKSVYVDTSNKVKKTPDTPLVEELVLEKEKQTVFPTKIEFTTSTPMEPNKALVKDEEANNVDVHLYKSMIGSLMYLTASRPDITFIVCAYARFQVTPKTLHLHAVNRIFRYFKGQPKLGLWYPRDSPFDLEAFSNSDYAGASLDRKSITGAEYVAVANCYGQLLWIQNQMLDYRFNFMNTKIYIDNESTICIMKNPKFHAKTKHIKIRHHFIRDSYEKRLIQVIKVHSNQNVADLLIKAFDVSRMVGRTCNIKRGQDTKIPQSGGPPVKVGDEAVHKELGDRMERAATTASSLEAEQDSGSGPRCQVTILGLQMLKLGLRLHLNSPMIHLSQELTHLEVGRTFWQTATASTLKDGDMGITATIDGKVKVVSEASIRRHLKLEDSDSISTLSTAKVFEQLALMWYVSNSDSLTFQKGHFSPQWKFLIHTILHCLSSKKTAWEQFSSNIATAIICLATNRTFNFSKLIFEAMVKNLDSKTKFLMYPRFIQIFLNKHKRLLLPHKRIYIAPTLTQKLFSNMKRASKGYTGVDTPLFQTMLVQGQTLQGEGSTIPVESHHTPTSAPSTSQPPTSSPSMPTTHVAEEAALMPYDSPLLRVHSLGSDEGSLTLNELTVLCTSLSKKVESLESDLKQTKQTYGVAYTKLIMKVKKLEHKVKSIKARRKVRLVISDDEDDLEDPSKQGRKIAQIDKDEGITLVQMGAQTQGRSDEDLMYETGVYDYPEGFTGPSISITTVEPVTTAGEGVSTARAIPEEVSTAEPDMDVTLAEALVDLLKSGNKKSPKPKARGISFQDPEEVARRDVISPPVSKISAKDKGN
ncbi:putative ribonuclease H-like domain-containing protein [Tanacetum coccineum]